MDMHPCPKCDSRELTFSETVWHTHTVILESTDDDEWEPMVRRTDTEKLDAEDATCTRCGHTFGWDLAAYDARRTPRTRTTLTQKRR